MTNEIHFDFGSLQIILLFAIIAVACVFFYFELKKIKDRLIILEEKNYSNPLQYPNPPESDKYDIEENIPPQELHNQEETLEQNIYSQMQGENDTIDPYENELSNEVPYEPPHEEPHNIPDEVKDELPDEVKDELPDEVKDELPPQKADNDEFINNILSNQFDDKENIEMNETKQIKPDYKSMTVSQLKSVCSDLNLRVTGNKTKLIERIENNNTIQF